MAGRQADASARMMKAARKLARHHGLKAEAAALEAATHRQPAIALMMQAEAIADMLEAVTKHMADMEAAQAEAEQEATKSAKVAAVAKPVGRERKADKDEKS